MKAVEITDADVRGLLAEAGEHGDLEMVAICIVALNGDLGRVTAVDDSVRRALERKGIVPEHVDADVRAREECERVILAARGYR